jgi:hypothetical protein
MVWRRQHSSPSNIRGNRQRAQMISMLKTDELVLVAGYLCKRSQ